ncbi:hypothetical protein CPLU01_15605 [Colletotrichum plurivorum]|uniref:Protein kinase domain-containing protein n=1 Tax=Colletotrichum plurivorum TaxID=2175906 RepID=A0A8H6J9M9_9PEZI|nr:hypothetical protein CPLU01_15605 [Colletotrichum plurivorum]
MSAAPDSSAPEAEDRQAALSAHYDKVFKKADEERRNAPVPSPWPDTPTSAIDSVQPPPVSANEYGILFLELSRFVSNIPGRWKPRVILEQDGSHTEFDLRTWVISGPGPVSGAEWGVPTPTLGSDIYLTAQPCEAVLHLLLERHSDSNQSLGGDEDAVMDLGSVSLESLTEPCTKRTESFTFKDAAVQMDVTVVFSRAHLQTMIQGPGRKWFSWSGRDLCGIELFEATDSKMFYLMASISAEDYQEGFAKFSLDNPWILPVRFVYKSPGRLHFLSPMSSSRHLLGRVQRGRRVTDEEARLYVAQLVCAIDSLHEMGVTGLLSSENVLLDVFGNVRIITPRLFTTDQNSGLDHLTYAAPEVLSGEAPSQLTDWWISGGFLYEILTGLPPFYHKDPAERDRRILMEELEIPTYTQDVTTDILRRLLEKNPTRRLGGVRGISAIKEHDFFTGVDWQHPTAGCPRLGPFQPNHVASIFKNSPSRGSTGTRPPRKVRESGGYLHEELDLGPWTAGPNPERIIGRPRRSSESLVFNPLVSEAWPQEEPLSPVQQAAKAIQADSEREGDEPEAVMARLKAALQTKQSTKKVAHILDGCASDILATVLKSPIVLVNDTPISAIAPETLMLNIPITALEWTVKLGRVDLLLLLLDRGADPNCTFDENYGPALVRAARERSTELVDVLAPKTSRIHALRTLCLAVEQRDIPTINCLLSHAVPCDFDEADHLLPPPKNSNCEWYHCEDFGQPA